MLKKYFDINTPSRHHPLEHEIDKLVHKLYGLTKEEIRIIEGRK